MEKCLRDDRIRAAAVAAAVGIYFAVVTALSPPVGDDVRFLYDYRLYGGGDGGAGFLRALWRFAEYMRMSDNGRLDNLLAFAALAVLPRWAVGACLGICAAAATWLGARFAGRDSWRGVLTMAAVMILLMPWREEGLSTVKCFNILVPAAITVGFLTIIVRPLSGRRLILALPLAVIAGGIHEGWALSAACGVAAYMAIRRRELPWRNFVTAGVFIVAMVATAWCPGLLMRSEATGGDANFPGAMSLGAMTAPLLLLAASLLIWRLRHRLPPQRSVMLMVSLLAGATVAVYGGASNVRAWWIADFYAAILLTAMLSPSIMRIRAAVLAGVLALFCGGVAREQWRSWELHAEIRREIDASAAGTVFRRYDTATPKVLLLHPVRNVWHSWLHINSANYGRTDGRIEGVVPPALAGISAAQSEAINSRRNPGAGFEQAGEGIWRLGGELVRADSVLRLPYWSGDTLRLTAATAWLRTSEGATVRVHLQRFVTPGGDTLIHIRPLRKARLTSPLQLVDP